MYLNSRTLAGASVWRDLGGVALLEDVCHLEQVLRPHYSQCVLHLPAPYLLFLLFLSLLYACGSRYELTAS